MAITIRKMTEADVAAATGVLAKWNMAPRPHAADPERSHIEVAHAFVALDGEEIVGMSSYLLLSPTEAETASLAVDPRYRGRGIGYRLQAARLEELRARGIEKVRTEADHPDTIQWYVDKFGYRVVGTNPKKHDFSLPDVDRWTVLELDLRQRSRG